MKRLFWWALEFLIDAEIQLEWTRESQTQVHVWAMPVWPIVLLVVALAGYLLAVIL